MAGNKETDPDIGELPKKEDLGIELGVEFNLPFATPYNDGMSTKDKENKALRELLREEGEDLGPSVSQLVAMRRLDGQARALYRLLTLPIRAALSKSTFVPAEGGEAEAEFIDLQFNLPPASGGMSVTFHKFMAQMLQGLFDGFAPFEQVYDYATYGPLKGKYVLRKLAYRQPSTITVIEDEDGHFQGFRQRAYRDGKTIDVHIPRDRAFYFAAQEEERKYYGVSFFQSAFYHYDKKIKMYYIAHLAAQRAAVGTRVGTVPANATANDKRTFSQNLSNLALAQWMLVPDGYKVEMLKEGGSFQFLEYINHHNNQMSKSILANFFDKDSGGASDQALVSFGQPGDTMFVLMLRAIMDDIANSINHYIIPRLIDWNFSGGKYPTFQWAELTDEQKAIISTTFDKLATAGEGVNVSPEFLREMEKKMAAEMGLEIDWDEVEAREAEEKEMMNLQQGIGPDGQPLPKDSMGNPIMPGQDNPEKVVQDFEAQLAGGNPAQQTPPPAEEEEPPKKVKLSADDELLAMAGELLELASTGDYRVVRTQAGAERFGVAIGQKIPGADSEDEDGGKIITIERLRSLYEQFEGAKQAGNEALANQVMESLRLSINEFNGSMKPSDFIKTMMSLKGKKQED